jgi:hypothetical protein
MQDLRDAILHELDADLPPARPSHNVPVSGDGLVVSSAVAARIPQVRRALQLDGRRTGLARLRAEAAVATLKPVVATARDLGVCRRERLDEPGARIGKAPCTRLLDCHGKRT